MNVGPSGDAMSQTRGPDYKFKCPTQRNRMAYLNISQRLRADLIRSQNGRKEGKMKKENTPGERMCIRSCSTLLRWSSWRM